MSAGVSLKRNSITSTPAASAGNDTTSTASVTSLPQQAPATSFSTTRSSPLVTAAVAPAVSTVGSRAGAASVLTPAALTPRTTAGNFVTDLVSGLLSAIGFGPQAAGGPTAPAQAPTLWTVLAWVRREIEQTFFPGSQNLAAVPTAALVQSPNLLVNPGAELGDPSLSGYSSVSMPGWSVTGTPTVIKYGTLVRIPWGLGIPGLTLPAFLGFPAASSAPPDSGNQFFGGGNVATSTLTQTVDLTAAGSDIDGGAVPYTLSAALGGYGLDPAQASVTVNFLDKNHLYLGSGTIAPVGVFDRLFSTGLLARQTTGTIPENTRYAQVVVNFADFGQYNNAYADNLSFTVGAPGLAPAPLDPPDSTVGPLDHVFMTYLENKGFDNIVGSPNAPYLNSIINAYGLASNYYALTHPSLPNYYPILGGSDFGVNYNCASDCFDEPNLVDELEAASPALTWAAYEQNGGGTTTPGQTPFLAFHDIFDNPARVAHILPLTQMATDLSSTATAPNFAWFQPDEDNNGEGPVDTLAGVLSFILTQFTDQQYNVKAADNFLAQNVPVIMNSTVWNDLSQKSAIFITFDEDNDNLSLGFGNQGNHIVTVVIPSPGAVAAGMRPGPFVATDYYNHYSLQRTIEDSLGLDPLTNNDKYAQPMNEFWT